MSTEMILPCFIPASQTGGEKCDSAPQSDMAVENDPLDFDLLAEYLLDDTAATGTTFDFSIESPPNEVTTSNTPLSVVSPDLASTAAPHANIEAGMFSIPVVQHSLSVAPAPTAAPAVAVPNIPAPLAPAPMSGPPSLPGIAPAPSTGLSQQMVVHQHKRPRLETVGAPHPVMAHTLPEGNVSKTGRQKSQAQIDRRRERNRILARRTRLRKKFFFESLQKEVTELQRENLALKEIVRSRIDPTHSKAILSDCTAQEKLPEAVLEHCGDPRVLGSQDFNLMTSIRQSQQSFVITDPSLQDNPIVYASDDFLELTGYSRDQVLGRNCRFLQGTDTNKAKVAKISKAIANGEDVSVTFINYMADGTAFWNKLFIAALRDAQNNIVNYIGVSVKVAGPEPGDPEAALATQNADAEHSQLNNALGSNEEGPVDADAAVMAIEGAVEKAVAAASSMTKSFS